MRNDLVLEVAIDRLDRYARSAKLPSIWMTIRGQLTRNEKAHLEGEKTGLRPAPAS